MAQDGLSDFLVDGLIGPLVTSSSDCPVPRQLRDLLPQVVCAHVRITLSGGDAGMAEKFLHGTQIGPRPKRVGSKGMAEQMWSRAIGDADALEVAIH